MRGGNNAIVDSSRASFVRLIVVQANGDRSGLTFMFPDWEMPW